MPRPGPHPARGEHSAGSTSAARVVPTARGDRCLSATRPIPRRGLSREESAQYIGCGSTKFDELVATGRMPKAKRIDGRRIWDILELDLFFEQLPNENVPPTAGNSWDDA